MKKAALAVVGALLMLVGVVGLILPILPGWPILFFGLSLIAPKLAERLKKRLFRKFFKSDIATLDEWKKSRVLAGFTTKKFPLFLQKTDDLLKEENQRRFTELFSPKENDSSRGRMTKFVVLGQTHGDGVAVLDNPSKYSKEGFYPVPACDAAMTNLPGLTLLVFSADCLPIFFLAGSWIALAHAGWKGTEQKIARKTLRLLLEKSGCRPKSVKIIFGPSISQRHYTVGKEFYDYFPASSLRYFGKGADRSPHFDLAGENRRQLVKSKVPADNITDYQICTVDENENFYSFRKEKDNAGRIISFIQKY